MIQARRKVPARKSGNEKIGRSTHIVILFAGMLIGVLLTILVQGMSSAKDGVGAGIRQAAQLLWSATVEPEVAIPPRKVQQQPQATTFTFFELLPGLEVIVPQNEDFATGKTIDDQGEEAVTLQQPPLDRISESSEGTYMLQAGSYQRRTDAEELKATLALNGMVSDIQKVSIEGRGDFYRVNLGPYLTYYAMEKTNQHLQQLGIRSLRFKVTKSG